MPGAPTRGPEPGVSRRHRRASRRTAAPPASPRGRVSPSSASCCSIPGTTRFLGTSDEAENPTPRRRIGPTSTGSSNSLRAVAIRGSLPGCVRQGGRPRQRRHVGLLEFDGDGARARPSASADGGRAHRSAPPRRGAGRGWSGPPGNVDSALICAGLGPLDHRAVVDAPGQPVQRRTDGRPRILATSASASAASCPTVSMPSRCSLSSATGPIPHNRRTGSASSRGRSSARVITRIPFGSRPGADLGDLLARARAHRCHQPGVVFDRVRNALAVRLDVPRRRRPTTRRAHRRPRRTTAVRGRPASTGRSRTPVDWPPWRPPRGGSTTAWAPPADGPGALASPSAHRTPATRSSRRPPHAPPSLRRAPGGPQGRTVSCSTDAKNASMSRCRTQRSTSQILSGPSGPWTP